MPRERCPVRPPAPAPTIALPMIEGGKMIPTSAPTAAPVQAPCWVGFSVFVTRTLPSVLLSDHRRVEGPDRSGGVEVEHGLVVGLGVRDLVVDGGVEKYGSVGHRGSLSSGP